MNKVHHPKLKHDAIIEALLEIRFDSTDLPEITVGRLADHDRWKKFSKLRTPVSDIPAAIRLADANLRYQPTLELREDGGPRVVKIGTNVVSIHNLRPYLGWTDFCVDLEDLIRTLFARLDAVSVRRLGLRYLNALDNERHYIEHISKLNVSLSIKDEGINEDIVDHFNVNFSKKLEGQFICMTRVATTDFVTGVLPDNTTAYADIDVFTPTNFHSNDLDHILEWLSKAHVYKNDAFFKLIPQAIIEKLREE